MAGTIVSAAWHVRLAHLYGIDQRIYGKRKCGIDTGSVVLQKHRYIAVNGYSGIYSGIQPPIYALYRCNQFH